MADRIETSNIQKFDGRNYSQWKFQVVCALKAKGLFEFVNGAAKKPEKTEEMEAWARRDANAMFVLTSAMEFKQIAIIENCSTAVEIMEKLDSIYQQKSEFNKMTLLEKFHRLKMEPSESVICYISRTENLVKQIKDAGETITETAVVTKILCTLPEKFRNFRQAWLSTEEGKQTLRNLTSRLLDEESNLGQYEESSESALSVAKYKLSKRSVICYNCRKEGHIARECKEPPSHKSRFQNRYHEKSAFLVSDGSVGEEMRSILASDVRWIMDSGASCHMTHIREILEDFVETSDSVVLGNSAKLDVKGRGNVQIEKFVSNEWIEGTIKDVMYVPELRKNLLSEGVITNKGMRIVKSGTQAQVFAHDELVGVGIRGENNLYTMLFKTLKPVQSELNVSETSFQTWHERLGHINTKFLSAVPDVVDDVKLGGKQEFFCEGCIHGKQHKVSFTRNMARASRAGELIHGDVCGPMPIPSVREYRYFVIFKDDFSGYRFVRFLMHKSDVLLQFKYFVNLCRNKFGHNVQRLRVDNGTEFVNTQFHEYLCSNGIVLEKTAPYSPEQNGRVERENRTVMESARSMLHSRDVPQYLWAEAVNTAVYLLNRTPNSLCMDKTPYEKWMGKRPSLSHARVFGCEAYSLLPSQKRNKLSSKSKKFIFVGYEGYSNNYRLFDPSTQNITVSRNVIFRENDLSTPAVCQEQCARVIVEDEIENEVDESCCKERQIDPADENEPEFRGFGPPVNLGDGTNELSRNSEPDKRNRRIPPKFQDFELNCVEALAVGQYPSDSNPRTFLEAVENGWGEAIQEELDVLDENGTWEFVCKPKGVEVIDSKWVFTEKDRDGQMVKKARLVARGCFQKVTEDLFAPVARMSTIRILLSLAVQKNMKIKQLDVKSAFLNGVLSESVYMAVPEGVDVCDSNIASEQKSVVCKLIKALYGLREAPKCWNNTFNDVLSQLGFTRSRIDACLYFNSCMYILIYVDDVLVVYNDEVDVCKIVEVLKERFKMTEFCNDDHLTFLGVHIERVEGGLALNQSILIDKILERFCMSDCKPCSLPIEPGLSLSSPEPGEICNVPFKELLGSLMYIMTGTRPDISFSVMYFSRFQNCFNLLTWRHLKNILKYLKGTRGFSLLFLKDDSASNKLCAFVDSDFGNDTLDRKSVTGYVLRLFNHCVVWRSKKQNVVSLSSCEAEYIAVSECVKDCKYVFQLVEEVVDDKCTPVTIFEDNQSAIKMTNTLETKRSRHIDVKYHFIREEVQSGNIKLVYVSSNEQVADVLTKSLSKAKFDRFRSELRVVDLQNWGRMLDSNSVR